MDLISAFFTPEGKYTPYPTPASPSQALGNSQQVLNAGGFPVLEVVVLFGIVL